MATQVVWCTCSQAEGIHIQAIANPMPANSVIPRKNDTKQIANITVFLIVRELIDLSYVKYDTNRQLSTRPFACIACAKTKNSPIAIMYLQPAPRRCHDFAWRITTCCSWRVPFFLFLFLFVLTRLFSVSTSGFSWAS